MTTTAVAAAFLETQLSFTRDGGEEEMEIGILACDGYSEHNEYEQSEYCARMGCQEESENESELVCEFVDDSVLPVEEELAEAFAELDEFDGEDNFDLTEMDDRLEDEIAEYELEIRNRGG